jgi:hypothetical protein
MYLKVSRAGDHPRGNPTVIIDPRPLLGTWVNYDRYSTGIRGIEIDEREGTVVLRTSGAGEPEEIDWGETVGAAFSDGVESHEAVGFAAHYNFAFLTVQLAAYLNKRLLVVDAYSVFTDSSGRANYFQRDHLYILDQRR